MNEKTNTELNVKTLKSLIEFMDSGNTNELKGIIIKFGATWCGPCKKIKPLCDECSNKLEKNVMYFDIDIDNNVELYTALKSKKMINGVPTLLSYVKRDRDMSIWYASDLSLIGADESKIHSFFKCINNYKPS